MKQIHALVLGEGSRNLIILHGFLGMGDNWKTHAKQWVAQGWRVHLIDQRNHGRSFWSSSFNYALLAEDIHQYFSDNALESATLLGHSMGGKVAMLFASLYPEKVNQLIVADIAPKTYPSHHQTILSGLASLDFSEIKSRKEADEALAIHVKDMGTRQFLLKNIYRVTPNQLGLRMNIDVLKNVSEQIGDTMAKTQRYHGETLFLKGATSGYIEEQDEFAIKHHFPRAKIVTIERAGHWLHAENPKDFAQAIEDWWKL